MSIDLPPDPKEAREAFASLYDTWTKSGPLGKFSLALFGFMAVLIGIADSLITQEKNKHSELLKVQGMEGSFYLTLDLEGEVKKFYKGDLDEPLKNGKVYSLVVAQDGVGMWRVLSAADAPAAIKILFEKVEPKIEAEMLAEEKAAVMQR